VDNQSGEPQTVRGPETFNFPSLRRPTQITLTPPFQIKSQLLIESSRITPMLQSILHPIIADEAPDDPALTPYDEEHLIVYIRLLDAEADGADWMEAALLVLRIDPILGPKRARNAWESHLSRAKWMTENGYDHLLRRHAVH
jgi:hypothetical protein